jgi:hypothetical protein
MPWPKVHPGQPIAIPASLQNRLIDLAAVGPAAYPGSRTPLGFEVSGTIVLARNPTQMPIPAYGVARATSAAVDPEEQLGQFLTHLCLALEPADADNAGAPIVIAQQQIEAGGVGPVLIAGMTPVRVQVQDPGDRYLGLSEIEAWAVISSPTPGEMRQVYRRPGEGTQWAYALLGGGGLAEGDPNGGGLAEFGFGGMMRAIIVGVAPLATDRWEYECVRAVGDPDPDLWAAMTGFEPLLATNPLEGGDATHLWSGIARENLQGFDPVPLRIGAPVLLSLIEGAWYITSTPQAVDGECGGS